MIPPRFTTEEGLLWAAAPMFVLGCYVTISWLADCIVQWVKYFKGQDWYE